MQLLQTTALPHMQPKAWIWYVDNTLIIIKREQLEKIHETVNNNVRAIIFTRGEENNHTLIFLELLINRGNGSKLEMQVCWKPECSIIKVSTNLLRRKCLRTLFREVQMLCNNSEHEKKERDHLWSTISSHKIDTYTALFKKCLTTQPTTAQPRYKLCKEQHYIHKISKTFNRLLHTASPWHTNQIKLSKTF